MDNNRLSSGERLAGDRSTEVVAVLIAARKKIENPSRWARGNINAAGHCAHTAISAVATDPANEAVAIAAFCKAAGIKGNNDAFSVWPWNDAPERTHAEVLAAFDRAITAERTKSTGA